MNLAVAFVLFFLLTPQLFFKFKGNKFMVAAVHALVFVAILRFLPVLEGVTQNVEYNKAKKYDYYGQNCAPFEKNDIVKPGDCGKLAGDMSRFGPGEIAFRCSAVTKDPKTNKTTCSGKA
jgi:hypothetical protein